MASFSIPTATVIKNEATCLIKHPQFYGICRGTGAYLEIKRPDGTMTIQSSSPAISGEMVVEPCYGILGIIDLLAGPYLLVIKDVRRRVGSLLEHSIYEVGNVAMHPLSPSANLSTSQTEMESTCLRLLNSLIANIHLYFSPTIDLTRLMQQQPDNAGVSLSHVRRQYMANTALIEPFLSLNDDTVTNFLMVAIHGYVEIRKLFEKDDQKLILISRFHNGRIGTRFLSRGVDKNGNCSNSVETEQILIHQTMISSYAQIRGSIPLFWSQPANSGVKPPIELVGTDAEQRLAFDQHFQRLHHHYGEDVQVCTLLEHGDVLNNAYQGHLRRLKIPHFPFDWHHEIKHAGDGDKLVNLMRRTVDQQGIFVGYHSQQQQTSIIKGIRRQTGIIRMNCLDCLDRTNCAQYELAKLQLPRQLVAVDLAHLNVDQLVTAYLSLLWSENGHYISRNYAGTDALKSEWILHGSKSTQGMLQDSLVSVHRYWGNNFGGDGERHAALQLFYGKLETDCIQSRPTLGVTGATKATLMVLLSGLFLLINSCTLNSTGRWVSLARGAFQTSLQPLLSQSMLSSSSDDLEVEDFYYVVPKDNDDDESS